MGVIIIFIGLGLLVAMLYVVIISVAIQYFKLKKYTPGIVLIVTPIAITLYILGLVLNGIGI